MAASVFPPEANGSEYEQVWTCKRTGKPKMAPKMWSHGSPRPQYSTCSCCKDKRSNGQ